MAIHWGIALIIICSIKGPVPKFVTAEESLMLMEDQFADETDLPTTDDDLEPETSPVSTELSTYPTTEDDEDTPEETEATTEQAETTTSTSEAPTTTGIVTPTPTPPSDPRPPDFGQYVTSTFHMASGFGEVAPVEKNKMFGSKMFVTLFSKLKRDVCTIWSMLYQNQI